MMRYISPLLGVAFGAFWLYSSYRALYYLVTAVSTGDRLQMVVIGMWLLISVYWGGVGIMWMLEDGRRIFSRAEE
jgi:hypothetical protein